MFEDPWKGVWAVVCLEVYCQFPFDSLLDVFRLNYILEKFIPTGERRAIVRPTGMFK